MKLPIYIYYMGFFTLINLLYHKKIRGLKSADLRVSTAHQGVFRQDQGYWFTPEPNTVMGGSHSVSRKRLAHRLSRVPSAECIAGIEYLISIPDAWLGDDQAKRDEMVNRFVRWLSDSYSRENIMCVLSGKHAANDTFGTWGLVTPLTEENKLALAPWFSPRSRHDALLIRLMKSLENLNPSYVHEGLELEGDLVGSRIVEGF